MTATITVTLSAVAIEQAEDGSLLLDHDQWRPKLPIYSGDPIVVVSADGDTFLATVCDGPFDNTAGGYEDGSLLIELR